MNKKIEKKELIRIYIIKSHKVKPNAHMVCSISLRWNIIKYELYSRDKYRGGCNRLYKQSVLQG